MKNGYHPFLSIRRIHDTSQTALNINFFAATKTKYFTSSRPFYITGNICVIFIITKGVPSLLTAEVQYPTMILILG